MLVAGDFLSPPVIAAERTEADREGWRTGFDSALVAAGGTISRLDHGLPVGLPLQMPGSQPLRERPYAYHWRWTRIRGSADHVPTVSCVARKKKLVS
jgi:hypothetical protein